MAMEIERHGGGADEDFFPAVSNSPETKKSNVNRLLLLSLNVFLLVVGSTGSPLILRIYFIHGGNRKWFSAALQTAGFPALLVPLAISFLSRRRQGQGCRFSSSASAKLKVILITPRLFFYSSILGLITGTDNFFYSYGVSYLPVSTSSLIISTQLGFTAVFAFLIVGHKFTAESINAVIILTFGAVVLGVHANGDRPEGESKGKYYIGFVMTLVAALVYGIVLPLVELLYAKAKQEITNTFVMEIQLILGLFATLVCVAGMLLNNDFQAIGKEAKEFGLGKTKYYLVVVFTAVTTQIFFLGAVGTINYTSAMFGGIIMSLSITFTEVLAVFFFHEKFDGEKGVALALSLWGSASYFYGEYKTTQKSKTNAMEVRRLRSSVLVSSQAVDEDDG
ncbi:hypothetical protein HPP92_021185 [Vanilla planifolia]|uniref:Probable purine permease n=1 Tax=Vanilla planifolia TaxID=51239 RepID=A0A835PXN6_VANPL|nr:hypothetical protein HPP92_021185 [Vanilla planifolia]